MTTPELIGARRLRRLLDDYGFVPKKRWGQNFVIDPNTIRKIVDVAELSATDRVLEVGAGAGSLTLALAATTGSVLAIETDVRLAPILQETVGELSNVEVLIADALRVPLSDIQADRMVGNLPYNLAATLVLRVLETAPAISSLTVMTQREVGERLAASPGAKSYGSTSALVAYWGRARVVARISRAAFWPAPNVDSVLIRIDRGRSPDVDRELLYEVIKFAFSQRRKTLRNSLSPISGSTETAEVALRAAGIDPGARAESLDLEGFVAVTRNLS